MIPTATPLRRSDLAVTLAVALIVLGPILVGRGFWLIGDMVFVPEQPWKASWLGLDGALPRAVPMDAIVSLLTHMVPGDLVQKGLLLVAFVAGGLGVARLVGEQPWFARAAAITLLCWNPWVHERLFIGQWAILLGYFLLPWVARAALRFRADPHAWGQAAVALTLSAVCGPSSGVMAVGVFATLGLGADGRGWWRAAGLAVAANLTWLAPAVAADAVRVSTDGVFEGFAARAESGAGTLASLVSLGGIWKTTILAGERTSATLVLLSCLLSLAAAAGVWRVRDRGRWLLLAGGALGLALLPVLGAGVAILEAIGSRVPAVALLRDSHRYLAPLGLVLAVGIAHAVTALRARIRPDTRALWGAIGLAVLAPPLLLPSLAWGGLGELERSEYPDAWHDVAARIGDDEVTVVLPWVGSYRGFEWNHHRAVLDPAPRLLPGHVLIDDSIHLTDRVVPAEDPRTRAVGRALATDDPAAALRAIGVRWVLIEEATGETLAERSLRSMRPVYGADGLRLIDLSQGGAVADDPSPTNPKVTVWRQIFIGSAHAATFLLLLVAVAWILRTRQ